MKKILILSLSILIFSSCKSIMGLNYEKLTKNLSLGMTKQEVLNIMGNDYYIESLSNTDEGKIEVLTFHDGVNTPKFTLYFLNNTLKEFHKYIPPHTTQEVRFVKE